MSIRIFISCVIAAVFAGVVIADDPNDLDYKPGELIVRFAPKANGQQRSKAERKGILDSIDGGSIKHSFKLVSGLALVKLPENSKVKDKIKAFKNKKGILYAEPNYRLKLLSTIPDDTYFDNLWGMHNTGQSGGTEDADIDASEAWDIATDAEDIIVAVIDTGVDYDHEDLAANMWVNQTELNGTTGVDDDGNGYIDDIYGWDCFAEDNDPMDVLGHGTHVAGTIGAIGNNDTGVAGVCWNVQIMAIKFLDANGEGWTTDAVQAIGYAVNKGANVLSNSWGGPTAIQSLENAIEAAGGAGVLFIASAGNSGNDNDTSNHYPSNYDLDNIISVMATDHNDDRSNHPGGPWASNYGAISVDLAAPDSGIYSCKPGDDYQYMSGTSMAAPHVAGACALVWSRNPALSHLQVKDIILETVDELESLEGLCVTGGRLNLHAAVGAVRLNLSVDDGIDEEDSVVPDEEITYTPLQKNSWVPAGCGNAPRL